MLKKVGRFCLNVFIVFVIVYVIIVSYSYVSIKVMKNKYVSLFGYTFFEVASGSMSPAIKVGDIVVVKLNSSYDEGDIITYYSDSNYITHRVMRKDNDGIVVRGDANNTDDGKINQRLVLGKVVLVLKSVYLWKKVILNVRVVVSFVITFILFGLTFSYKNIVKWRKYRKRKIHYNVEKKVKKKKRVVKKGKKL